MAAYFFPEGHAKVGKSMTTHQKHVCMAQNCKYGLLLHLQRMAYMAYSRQSYAADKQDGNLANPAREGK